MNTYSKENKSPCETYAIARASQSWRPSATRFLVNLHDFLLWNERKSERDFYNDLFTKGRISERVGDVLEAVFPLFACTIAAFCLYLPEHQGNAGAEKPAENIQSK